MLFHSVLAAYSFNRGSISRDHVFLSANENDTSVISVTDKASLKLTYANVLKYGYSENLLTASFYGFNAAVHVVSVIISNILLIKEDSQFCIHLGQWIHRISRKCQYYSSQWSSECLLLWHGYHSLRQ